MKTAKQRTIIQDGDWYTGRWWTGCYSWYSEEGPGRAAAPSSPLLAVPNVTAHPSTASVPSSYYSMWHYYYLRPLKGFKCFSLVIIIIIVIITTMFMVLSSWQSHCESSPGSFDECRMAPSSRRPKTKPDDLGCKSACTGCQKLHPPSPFIITQPES